VFLGSEADNGCGNGEDWSVISHRWQQGAVLILCSFSTSSHYRSDRSRVWWTWSVCQISLQ